MRLLRHRGLCLGAARLSLHDLTVRVVLEAECHTNRNCDRYAGNDGNNDDNSPRDPKISTNGQGGKRGGDHLPYAHPSDNLFTIGIPQHNTDIARVDHPTHSTEAGHWRCAGRADRRDNPNLREG